MPDPAFSLVAFVSRGGGVEKRRAVIKPTLADYLRELSDELTVMLRNLVEWAAESGISGGIWEEAEKLLDDVEGEGWREVDHDEFWGEKEDGRVEAR